MSFGILDTQYVDLGPNVDADYIRSLQLRSGLEMADFVRLVDRAMGEINTGLDEVLASLVTPTTSVTAQPRRTTRKVLQRSGEYTMNRPQRGKSTAHMLPIDKHEIGIAVTEDGLHEMSLDQFAAELRDIVLAWRMGYKLEILERLFSPDEIPVDDTTNVLSPGFAGSGTGANVVSGIFPNGAAIPGGYSHYFVTTAANLGTALRTYRDRINRFHPGPLDAIVSPAMADLITGLGPEFFTPAGSPLIRPAQGDAEALVDANAYIGVAAGRIRVRQPDEALGSDPYIAIYKSYGQLADGNPLAWRYEERRGREVFTRSRELFPLANASTLQWFGIGVMDRFGAAVGMVDATETEYAAPTLSV